jgi:hypothetical protein
MASLDRRQNGIEPPPRWQHPALTSDIPLLRAAAERARQLGEANGWSRSTIRCAIDGLTVLLDGRPEAELVTLTEIRARTARHASAPRVAEVLAGLGLLEDDTVRPPSGTRPSAGATSPGTSSLTASASSASAATGSCTRR